MLKRLRRIAIWGSVRGLSRCLLAVGRLLYGLEIHGREHLPPQGPFIVAGNHSSRVDFFVVASFASVMHEMPVVFSGIPAITNNRLLAWLCRELDILPKFKAEGLSAASLLHGYNLLKQGKILGVGGIDGEWSWDGRLQPLRPGPAWLALRTGAPIILVLVRGGYDIWPRWARRPHLTGKLILRISRPLYLGEAPVERVTQEMLREANRRIMAEIQTVLEGHMPGEEKAW
jgi:1-acyl-sn-glycerol-3-phosphate acyltransferase